MGDAVTLSNIQTDGQEEASSYYVLFMETHLKGFIIRKKSLRST